MTDYFTATPLPAVVLAVDGSALTGTSGVSGSYRFPDVPRNTTVTVVGQLTNYWATRNVAVTLATTDVDHDLQVVSVADANRQYTEVALTQSAASGSLYVDLVDGSGQPRTGNALADLTLTNGGTAVGAGPYLFGTSGDLDPALTATTAFGERSRVAFLNVPPGTHLFSLALAGAAPVTLSVVVSADGVTLGQR